MSRGAWGAALKSGSKSRIDRNAGGEREASRMLAAAGSVAKRTRSKAAAAPATERRESTMSAREFARIRARLDGKAAPFSRFVKKRKPGPGRPPSGKVTHEVLARALKVDKRTVERYGAGELSIPAEVARFMRQAPTVKAAA